MEWGLLWRQNEDLAFLWGKGGSRINDYLVAGRKEHFLYVEIR